MIRGAVYLASSIASWSLLGAGAQFVPSTPERLTVVPSDTHHGVSISHKEPSLRICESTGDVRSSSCHVHPDSPSRANTGLSQDYDISTFSSFTEPGHDPTYAPPIIWLNGGPQSSSIPDLLSGKAVAWASLEEQDMKVASGSWKEAGTYCMDLDTSGIPHACVELLAQESSYSMQAYDNIYDRSSTPHTAPNQPRPQRSICAASTCTGDLYASVQNGTALVHQIMAVDPTAGGIGSGSDGENGGSSQGSDSASGSSSSNTTGPTSPSQGAGTIRPELTGPVFGLIVALAVTMVLGV